MRVLHIDNLSKHYGRIKAVERLSLEVEAGMAYGILGPNGSGKTTTLGMVLGITRPASGSFEWFEGRYGAGHRRHLGALLETPNFYPYLNAEKNLSLVAHIKGAPTHNLDELLELVNLRHRKTSRFSTYSLGMKQRLAIAAAMIGDPEVLILDEPTNGLDPQGIAEVRETIRRIAGTGKTIIMASHILDEVEKVCSHVGIIKNGQLLASGTVGAIISDDYLVELGAEDLSTLHKALLSHPGIKKAPIEEGLIIAHFDEKRSTAEINAWAFQQGITLSHLRPIRKSLEAEFLEITSN
ncbi:ABC transporter ATP-binding protein [Phaeodactylibacter luteus]|uniref:ABC transporter ATP-binding protein n=1 Tax=Phaeodactylibacter luteus TaxID=1564516 RepID=A0A5C6RY29_9BACT|nr:ABC transporter ATP-binding protein [Phaeodactylibacter luteus]TXB66540.1 ABC transporter ATP-binding protein [Phaeodactylibacter luteus]